MNIKDKIQKNIPLAPFTTFKIGGSAEYFIEIKQKEELSLAVKWAKDNKKDINIVGGGSNILINDQGVKGLIIKFENDQIQLKGERIECDSGVNLNQILSLATQNALSGLEWVVGIPRATVGGAVRGNAGAFEKNISDVTETVEAFDFETEKFKIFSNKDCDFAYRESIFKKSLRYFIWSVTLKMTKDDRGEINRRVDKILRFREKQQPNLPSAGSIFKNVSFKDIKAGNDFLAEEAKKEKVVKDDLVAAGWIIDKSGLKGKTIGGAKISLEHANFIVNTGKATSEDIIMLISYIKQQVRDRFKVRLREEMQYLGY